MKYVALSAFVDLKDNRHKYEVGDEYPRAGLTATTERIAELSGAENLSRKALIMAVEEEPEKAEEPTPEPKPEKAPEKKPAAKKPRKTATK